MAIEDMNTTGMETSADMIMPLPLTEEQIENLTDENYTMEVTDIEFSSPEDAVTDATRRGSNIFPNNPLFPNNTPNITVIPIIPGVTRFSYIRYLNASPSTGPIDIYVNGRKVASYLNYRAFTEYMKVFPGYYRIVVFRAGTIRNPIRVSRMNVIANRIYTAAFINNGTGQEWEFITDTRRVLNPNRAFVRFIQLSANAPLLDVYIDNRLVLTDLDFQEVSRYLSLAPGRHNLKLKVAASARVILEDPDMTLQEGKAYSVYIVGDMADRVGLQVLIPLEGTTYLSL